MEKRGTLYRLYDSTGNLLYVGETGRGWPQRMREHLRDKPWFNTIATIRLQQFPTKADALAAELAAIQNEHPRHNIKHNGNGSTPDQPWTDCPCEQPDTYDQTQWVVTSRSTHYERKTSLWLMPEMHCESVVDDVWEASGDEQLEYWLRYIYNNPKYREQLLADAVPICWFIAGSNLGTEVAPFQVKHYPSKDFSDHFYWPYCSHILHDDVEVDYFQLPVVVRFPALYEALGWTPGPLQPYAPIHSIIRSSRRYFW